MQQIVLILTLVFSTIATAAEIVRCGKDDFGNIVCLDKDGMVTSPPKGTAGDGTGSSASGVTETDSKSGYIEPIDWLRCGIDPFGNKVCRP